jgi:hypothetical protein
MNRGFQGFLHFNCRRVYRRGIKEEVLSYYARVAVGYSLCYPQSYQQSLRERQDIHEGAYAQHPLTPRPPLHEGEKHPVGQKKAGGTDAGSPERATACKRKPPKG